jgi:hypothetical protein
VDLSKDKREKPLQFCSKKYRESFDFQKEFGPAELG